MPEKPRRELPAMRRHSAPNLVILSRAAEPPIARLRDDDAQAQADDAAETPGESARGTKQEIRGMSAKSALAIARVLSSLDWGKNGQCLHVTATYWKHWPPDKKALARAKAEIVRDLGRHAECGIWRLEYQRRETPAEKKAREAEGRKRRKGEGRLCVPHWHFLLWLGSRPAEPFQLWVQKWWAEFSGNTSPRAVAITLGDQARGTWYLAMHAAKREQSPPFAVGRWWGYINREKFLSAQDLQETGVVDERARVWWARLYRRATGCKTRHEQGLSWFLPRSYQCAVESWIQSTIEHEKRERFASRDPF
jgi:hypothetical protein